MSTQTHAKEFWARVFNEAETVFDLERASVLMEKDDYIRHSEDFKGHFDKEEGTNPPTDLEREYVYWKIANSYLFVYERYREKENLAKANIYMRKLIEIPNRHLFSEYLIARIQELNGEDYSSKIKIPKGMYRWEFGRYEYSVNSGQSNFFIDDVSKEYKETTNKKRTGFLKVSCWVVMICVAGIKFDNEIILKDLHKPFYISVVTMNGEFYKPER
jgi:hypothetical protein